METVEDEGNAGNNMFEGNDTQSGICAGSINYDSQMKQEPLF